MSAPPSPSLPPWPTAAVLRHTLASGAWHFDWLLAERQPMHADDRCARAFRVAIRPDQMQVGQTAALEEQPVHRALYLALAAPTALSSGRGMVEPVAAGRVVTRPAADAAADAAAGAGRELHGRGGAAGEALSKTQDPVTVTVEWVDGNCITYRITHTSGEACVECVCATSSRNPPA